jgi:hypothetical protein
MKDARLGTFGCWIHLRIVQLPCDPTVQSMTSTQNKHRIIDDHISQTRHPRGISMNPLFPAMCGQIDRHYMSRSLVKPFFIFKLYFYLKDLLRDCL